MTSTFESRDQRLARLARVAISQGTPSPTKGNFILPSELVGLATRAPDELQSLLDAVRSPEPTETFLELEASLGLTRMRPVDIRPYAIEQLGFDDHVEHVQFISRRNLSVPGFMERELIIWQYAESPNERPTVQGAIRFDSGEYHLPTGQRAAMVLLDIGISGYA